MKHISLPLALIALLIMALMPFANAAGMLVKETPLTNIEEYLGTLDGVGETLLVSPDCSHIALVVKRSGELAWQIDGSTQKYFSNIGPGQWSPDSRHFSFTAPEGKRWRLYIDGKAGAAYDKIGFPVWSPDSSKMSYIAQQNGKFFIISDNKKSKPFDDVTDLQYNADGSSLAAVVRDDGKDHVWMDGDLKFSDDQINQFVWSAQGSHYAFASRDNAAWRVFHDETPGKAVESVHLLTISPDGLHVAYVATISSGYIPRPDMVNTSNISATTQLLIADEKTLDSQIHAGYVYTGIIYSPDSQHLAWTAGYFGQVVVPTGIPPKFPDGGATGMHVFKDGKAGPGFTNVSAPVWSGDSRHIAYGAVQVDKNDVTKCIIEDDKPSEAYYDVTQPVWNPTSDQLAYAAVPLASRDKSVVFNDGKKIGEYDTASDLHFNADGKYFSFLALGDKGVVAIINGIASPPYDGFLGNAKSTFDSAGHLHVIALKKKHDVASAEFGLQ